MDTQSHIKMYIDEMIENSDIVMCGIYKERSGTTLLKIRFVDPEDGPTGEATQNSNIYFRRKSKKQLQRDITRTKVNNKNTDISSRTRSKTENLRCNESPSGHVDDSCFGVASPEICFASHSESFEHNTESSNVQCYSPDPPSMRNDINTVTHDADTSSQNVSHQSEESISIEKCSLDPAECCSLPDIEQSDCDRAIDDVQSEQNDCQSHGPEHSETYDMNSPSTSMDSESTDQIRLGIRETIRDVIRQSIREGFKDTRRKKKKPIRSESQDNT